jgi:hypothetical protein
MMVKMSEIFRLTMPNAQLELTHLEGALHYIKKSFSANNQIDKLILKKRPSQQE